ncbi:uncharacterized protein LOC112350356 isoform X1 [Selaginella moellendorffii]|uniref:uncharacterized protein LOC112350356 isoform X1 n=1 Tax=Selaginella moellendorffii TaxID=88036 RepID=UPI000D1C4853|nr:uncharacterized protein LOC112350356 isoform X1 [Selaginella moellendorffii]|eukprot:XP_024542165.1 uncharacterized protein LOC112350356 isoform X1 [Selaginella moellendorffii]
MGIHKLYGVKIATAYSCPARPTPRSDHGSGGGSSRLLGSGDLEATQQQEEWCLRSLWERRPNFLRAFHSSHRGDRNLVETVINVATSLPFVLIGIQMPRQKPLTRLYADSLIGVGLASTLFHASRGEARKYFRWGDYTMIATSTLCLSRALQTDSSKALYCASAMLLPFQPFVVAACHTGLMEAAFVRRALKQPSLQKAYTLHTISTVVGGTLFIADDMYPDTPFLHAAWHIAAAVGVTTCNKLLNS